MHPLIDHHTHTNYSPDASKEASMEAHIKKAKALGLKGVMFTDHVDLDTPVDLFQSIPEYYAYTKKVKQLNEKDFFVGLGIEIGYQAHLKKPLNHLINAHDFDFVICSMHIGDGLDFHDGDFFKEKTDQEAIKRYFELVKESVQNFDDYDVYGHIDYITRYLTGVKDYDFEAFEPIIDEILKTIIQKQKGIEINTSGLRYNLGFTHPKKALLKRYKALGGRIITLGSDAHHPRDLTADFNYAKTLLKAVGFNEITQFKQRNPYQIKI